MPVPLGRRNNPLKLSAILTFYVSGARREKRNVLEQTGLADRGPGVDLGEGLWQVLWGVRASGERHHGDIPGT
jgi:hypothetical protein